MRPPRPSESLNAWATSRDNSFNRCGVLSPMSSYRMARFRYRLETAIYQMRREQALRAARLRYRFNSLRASSFLKLALLALLGAAPFVLFFLFQPLPTGIEDGANIISRNVGPPAPLAFPTTSPTPPPGPDPSPIPTSSPSESPSPSPSPSPNKPRCSNGRDDDRDGGRDFPADRGCTSRSDNTESPNPVAPPLPAPPPAQPAPPEPVQQENLPPPPAPSPTTSAPSPTTSAPSPTTPAPSPTASGPAPSSPAAPLA